MNRRERALGALKGEAVDRPSVFSANSTATKQLAEMFGQKWPLFHQRAEDMARMALGALDVFDFDAVRLPFCQTIEAEAFGCEVSYKDFIPNNDKPLYSLDVSPQYPEDFLNRGRIPELLEAIRILKRQVDGKALVLGGVQGSLTIARALLDSVPLLKASMKTPDKIIPFLEIGKKASIEMALALIEAGAEVIVIEDMTSSPDLLHPKTYKNMIGESHRQIIEAIPVPVILHICGNVTLIGEEMANSNARALSIDPKAEVHSLRGRVGKQIPLIGGVDTVALSLSNPREIKEMCLNALKGGINILAPGCAIPPDSPIENIRAMIQAAEEFRGA